MTDAVPSPLRRTLDALYDGAGVLAAIAMVALLVLVLLSIGSRQVGVNLPGLDAYAGYAMAAAGFLALAHTLKRGEHIRVTLLVGRLQGGARRGLEVWAAFAAFALATLFAGYSTRLAWQSQAFHDISTSNDATPLWIPQLSMAVGAIVLAIACLDELVLELRHRRGAVQTDELLRNE